MTEALTTIPIEASETGERADEADLDVVGSLWSACHVLRDDGLSSYDYMLELSYLLFLKLLNEAGREGELPAGCRWSDLFDGRPGLLGRYKAALERLSRSTQGRVATIFSGAHTRIRNEAALNHVIKRLRRHAWFRDSQERLGDAYEGLLERAAAERKSGAGQYFTPRPLVESIVALTKPADKEILLDPACGTGGFLVSAAASPEVGARIIINHIGVELVPDVARLALMNLAVHGLEGDVLVGDSLYDSRLDIPPADLILSNPPFGTRGMPEMRFSTRVPIPTRNKQLAFLQLIVNQLRPGGRAAVVLPDNVLFEGGVAEAVRTQLVDACYLHTILRLPAGLFYATGVRTNVLFFTRRPTGSIPSQTERLWIFDARTAMPTFGKRQRLTRNTFEEFEDAFGDDPYGLAQRADQGPGGRFRSFSLADLRAEGLNLDVTWLAEKSGTLSSHRLASEMEVSLSSALEALAELEVEIGR
ncbi:MAG: N-6 DNA methylase [Actinobacteria bacterium]|nr:N-6 DNA methylase [Actinomycetota bacterium]